MNQQEFMDGMRQMQNGLSYAERENLYGALLYATDLGKWNTAVKTLGPGVWTALETSTRLNSYLNHMPHENRGAIMGFLEKTVKDLARDFSAARAAEYHSLVGEMKAQYC
jgi:hypothetical protein